MLSLDFRHNLHDLMHKHDTLMQMPLSSIFVHVCRQQWNWEGGGGWFSSGLI